MSRPKKSRCVGCTPHISYFKPRGVPLVNLEEICINLDELEAMRLADYEGLYHEQAALNMNISRATFGRIIGGARHKVVEALIEGKALRIETTNKTEVTL